MATPFINQGCSKPDTALPQVLLTPVSGLRWTETRSTWQRLKLQWGGVSRKSSLPQVKPLPRLPCQSQHWTRRPHSAHGPRPSFRNTHFKTTFPHVSRCHAGRFCKGRPCTSLGTHSDSGYPSHGHVPSYNILYPTQPISPAHRYNWCSGLYPCPCAPNWPEPRRPGTAAGDSWTSPLTSVNGWAHGSCRGPHFASRVLQAIRGVAGLRSTQQRLTRSHVLSHSGGENGRSWSSNAWSLSPEKIHLGWGALQNTQCWRLVG